MRQTYSDITCSELLQSCTHTHVVAFNNEIDFIGYDWKTYDFNSGNYVVDQNSNYIIKTNVGFYYKLHFLNLYDYLETMILWMDSNHPNPNFHIKFLIELTRFIGFYPNISNKNKKYFDLSSGCFTDKNNSENILSISNMRYFKEILGMDFDQIKTLNWNHNIRIDILNEIIRYYTIPVSYTHLTLPTKA